MIKKLLRFVSSIKGKIYRIAGHTHYFETKYGIKAYNKPPFVLSGSIDSEIVEIDPQDIFLGFDGLNDKYTLIDTPIVESPHYHLLKLLNNNESIEESEYRIRELNGSLDGRMSIRQSNSDDFYRKKFISSKEEVTKNTYLEPLVYKLNGRYYVLDGKHRIAMCYLLGKKVQCRVFNVCALKSYAYILKIYKIALEKKDTYSKNITHISSICKNNRNKRILIVNRNLTNNLGDQAIGHSMMSLFDNAGADVYLSEYCNFSKETVIGNNSPKTIHNGNHSIISKIIGKSNALYYVTWWIKNNFIFQILHVQSFDYVIIGGGELIQSNRLFPIALYTWVKQIGKYQKKSKIILFSVGVTGNFSRSDYSYIKKSMKYIDKVYVRDAQSYKNIGNCFNINAVIIPDSVYYENRTESHNKKEEKLILYGVTDYCRIERYNLYAKDEIEYYQKTRDDLIKLHEEYGDSVCLFYTTKLDKFCCIEIKEKLLEDIGIEFKVCNIQTLSDLINLMHSTMEVYSPRMHGCILAETSGVKRIYPIIISPKMNEYCNNLKCRSDYNHYKDDLVVAAKYVINV